MLLYDKINKKGSYVKRREERQQFLNSIVESLKADGRFVSVTLTGSSGKPGGGDEFSDIDLRIIVDDRYADEICRRAWMVGGRTTEERWAIFKQFGQPAIIHENHHNAPTNGTFTSVTYAENAMMVDYVFVPQANAPAPKDTEPKEDRASEKVSFFWMLLAISVKYLLRHDIVRFHTLLSQAHKALIDVAGLVENNAWQTSSGSLVNLSITQREQTLAVRSAARQMLELMPKVVAIGGYVPVDPMAVVEKLLALPPAETPLRDNPITNIEDDREKVKRLIHALETYIGQRLPMYIGEPTPENLLTYLYAIETTMSILLSPRNKGRDYKEEVIRERGWVDATRHPHEEMKDRGMDNDAILQEMIVIEIETWKRTYGIE
jgi:hypothetical protein